MAKPSGAARLRSILVGRKQSPNIRSTYGDDLLQPGLETWPFGSKFMNRFYLIHRIQRLMIDLFTG